MSQVTATLLGAPAPNLGQFNTAAISEQLEDQYQILREKCLEQYGPDFCNAVLPRNMVYAVTREGFTLPWWVWMILGLLAGRVLK